MTKKQLSQVVSVAFICMHMAAIIKDLERCKINRDNFAFSPTLANFARLLVAEGVLIRDFG